jgi:hypothetical protein
MPIERNRAMGFWAAAASAGGTAGAFLGGAIAAWIVVLGVPNEPANRYSSHSINPNAASKRNS